MISGRHKSVPSEIKRALRKVLPRSAKVVMNDICSCRHKFSPGTLKVVNRDACHFKIRAYYGSGIVNLFVKVSDESEADALEAELSA